jgi:hypothetical protein
MPEPTKARLAAALKDAGHHELAERAARGEYDDIETTHAAPKIELVAALVAADDEKFARRVSSGEFDNTSEEWKIYKAGFFDALNIGKDLL